MSKTADVAVIILTLNEAIHLRRAIEHITPFAKEIFVIDSGSTDGTVELARSLGAHVMYHPFQSPARQFQWALDNAPITAEWVMKHDADEVVEPKLAQEIVQRLPTLPPEITGVNLKCKTIFQGKFIRYGGRYPLTLLRIWRRGKARMEDRWTDEHIYLTEGRIATFRGTFANHDLRDLTFFIEKHNRYSSREALEVLNERLQVFGPGVKLTSVATSHQAKIKRFIKQRIFRKIPYEISAFAYFFFRYVIQLGFLDGREGLAYHVIQGYWQQFVIGAKARELEAAVRKTATPEEMRDTIMQLTRLPLDRILHDDKGEGPAVPAAHSGQ